MIYQSELINQEESILIIIDMQERLINAIPNKNEIIWNIKKLVDAFNILEIKKLYSEQSPEKLGRTLTQIRDEKCLIYKKMDFSACSNEYLMKEIEEKKDIVICGIESHVCVQQTALELKSKGYNVFVVIDAISSRNSIDHTNCIYRLKLAGTIISTTESIIFELCKTANRKEFKSISKIIKRPKHELN